MIDLTVSAVPASPGSYALQLHLAHAQSIVVGRLGLVQFPAGAYFYLGNAFGPGGLRARLSRHLRRTAKRTHWHIDYLRAVAPVRSCFITVGPQLLECRWSQALSHCPSAAIPVPHFGSTDCHSGCRSHLVLFPADFDLAALQRTLAKVAGQPLQRLI